MRYLRRQFRCGHVSSTLPFPSCYASPMAGASCCDCGTAPARARDLCATCYARHRRRGTLPPKTRKDTQRSCKECGTSVGLHGARDLCSLHYQRLTKSRSRSTAQPVATLPDVERFWAKVDRSGGPHACWPFTKSSVSRRTGYGNFWLNGKTVLAHRVAYALTYGPIPDFDEE